MDQRDAPPWLDPPTVSGYPLFPLDNTQSALEFFLVVGALNYSYWLRDGDEVKTWGVETEEGNQIRDVFALCYCLRRAVERDQLSLTADDYREISYERVREIFSGPGGNEIPMVETRQKKFNELGKGLHQFAETSGESPTFSALLGSYRTTPAVLDALERFFPYSFGDPFRKLSQLLLKMVIDRTASDRLENTPEWLDVARNLNSDTLGAQPDYMLPLFCLKTGLWEVDDRLETMFRERRELPMDHPVEREIRSATVETVERLAKHVDEENGQQLRGAVDSVMWITAVEGCFPVDCEGCDFFDDCEAVQGDNDRLQWDHHLTRTTHY